jgi:hypothetical protein
MDWNLIGTIFRNPWALMLLVVCGIAAGYALSSSSVLVQLAASVVAVAAFSGAVHLVRRT